MKELCKCLACGHEWERGKKYPVRCPSCRSTTWDTTGAQVHKAVRSPTNYTPKTTRKRGVQNEERCNGVRKPHTFEWQSQVFTVKTFYVQVCTVCGFRGTILNKKPPEPKPPATPEKYREMSAKANAVRWKDHTPKVKEPKPPRTPEQRSIDARKGALAANAARAKRKREALVQGAFYAK
jgi:DNA-directed RNA polymerase subunit RPC12/RpoP